MKSMYNDRTMQVICCEFERLLKVFGGKVDYNVLKQFICFTFQKWTAQLYHNFKINRGHLLLSAVFQVRSLSSKLFSIYQHILMFKLHVQTDNKIVQTVMPPREK